MTVSAAGRRSGASPSQSYTLGCAKQGVASALITDRSDTASHGLRSEHVRIQPGDWYEAAVHVRIAERKQGGFALYLEFWNRARVRIEDRSEYTERVGPWVRLTLRFRAPADACTATVLVYGSSRTVGRAYFDSASLRAGDTARPR